MDQLDQTGNDNEQPTKSIVTESSKPAGDASQIVEVLETPDVVAAKKSALANWEFASASNDSQAIEDFLRWMNLDLKEQNLTRAAIGVTNEMVGLLRRFSDALREKREADREISRLREIIEALTLRLKNIEQKQS